jgi:hypothetical protein
MIHRIKWLDFLKSVAMLAVIADHTFGLLYKNKNIQGYMYFSVTVFIFLAGITAAISLDRKPVIYRFFVSQRFIHILIPYSIATIIIHVMKNDGKLIFITLFTQLISFSAAGPFYFILFYLQLVAVSPFLFDLFKRSNSIVRIFLLFIIFYLANLLNEHTVIQGIYGGGGRLLGGSYLFIFSLGLAAYFYLTFLTELKKTFYLLIMSSLSLFFFAKGNHVISVFSNPPNLILMWYSLSLAGFLISIWAVFFERNEFLLKIITPLNIVGRHSLYIFLFHKLFLQFSISPARSLGLFQHIWILRVWVFAWAVIGPVLFGIVVEYILHFVRNNKISSLVEIMNEISDHLWKSHIKKWIEVINEKYQFAVLIVKKLLFYKPLLLSIFLGVATSWLVKDKAAPFFLGGRSYLTRSVQIQTFFLLSLANLFTFLFFFFFHAILLRFPSLFKILDIEPITNIRQKFLAYYHYLLNIKGEFIPLTFLANSLPLFLGWVMYLIAYWPGQSSPDVANQWEQIVTERFNDAHPAFHTLTMWLITRFWFSPAAITLAQIFSASVVVGWILMIMEQKGLHKNIVRAVIVVMILSPVFGMFLITPWKDIPFSLSVLLLTSLVFLVIQSNGEWLNKTSKWVIFGIITALVMLFRHNGTLVGAGTLIALLFTIKKRRTQILMSLFLCIFIWVGIRYPVYDLVGVVKKESRRVNLTMVSIIARHVIGETPLSPNQANIIFQILPRKDYDRYNCDRMGAMLFGRNIKIKISNFELLNLTFDLSKQEPRTTIEHIACSSSFIWALQNHTKNMPGYFYEYPVAGINQFINLSKDWSPNRLSQIFDVNNETSMEPALDWLVWRPAFWFYLFTVSLILYIFLTKNWRFTLVAIPLLLNTLPLILISPGQLPRYVLSTFFISILFSPFFLFSSIKIIVHRFQKAFIDSK